MFKKHLSDGWSTDTSQVFLHSRVIVGEGMGMDGEKAVAIFR